jgi:hypothetical protein
VFKTGLGAARPSEVIDLLREAVKEVSHPYDEAPIATDTSLKPVLDKAEQADKELERSIEVVLKSPEESARPLRPKMISW